MAGLTKGHPEAYPPSMGFILLGDDLSAGFWALSRPQRGYFLHCVSSSPRKVATDAGFRRLLRKAKEQRPSRAALNPQKMEDGDG